MLWGTVYGVWRLRLAPRRATAAAAASELAPVSVLKPIKDADQGLAVCLESFFHIDYPCFEILFNVADEADPAVPIIRELLRRYPSLDQRYRLIIGDVPLGLNPKVNNLAWPLALARYDLTLISDAGMRVPRDYLHQMVPLLKEKNFDGAASLAVRELARAVAEAGQHGAGR